jgi:hypothetical protein
VRFVKLVLRYVALGLVMVAIISTLVWYGVMVLKPIIASFAETPGGT